jgi:hypothetical protein
MQFSKKPILNNNLNGEKSPNLADLHFCCPNMAVPGKMFFFSTKQNFCAMVLQLISDEI